MLTFTIGGKTVRLNNSDFNGQQGRPCQAILRGAAQARALGQDGPHLECALQGHTQGHTRGTHVHATLMADLFVVKKRWKRGSRNGRGEDSRRSKRRHGYQREKLSKVRLEERASGKAVCEVPSHLRETLQQPPTAVFSVNPLPVGPGTNDMSREIRADTVHTAPGWWLPVGEEWPWDLGGRRGRGLRLSL